ncbi:MAG: DUF3667 domain-containing protein [Bacteroidaceae bacterium]|nr:DUF3667 domain-containing protein [Bacteroidaceae bacterium]
MDKNTPNLHSNSTHPQLPYKNCLNCGAELKGMYCHNCGQMATSKTPTVKEFILEYLNNAFIWDTKFFHTLWNLIRRPGYLTNEYLAGKFVSQEHPLKLNMFLLFVFVTIFVFFSGTERMANSVLDYTTDERVYVGFQINNLQKNPEYAEKLKTSPRDTIQLQEPLVLAESSSEIITALEIFEDTKGKGEDKWTAIIPRVLITDEIFVPDNNGWYHFNKKSEFVSNDLDLINSIWKEMVNMLTNYFPMLVLFTAPILSMAVRLVHRKNRFSRINHFIFSLHYTAFLEFLMICIYVMHLTMATSMQMLNRIMIIGSCLYLTIAFRRVYANNTWIKSIFKALLVSLIYMFIGLCILSTIFLVAIFVIADVF